MHVRKDQNWQTRPSAHTHLHCTFPLPLTHAPTNSQESISNGIKEKKSKKKKPRRNQTCITLRLPHQNPSSSSSSLLHKSEGLENGERNTEYGPRLVDLSCPVPSFATIHTILFHVYPSMDDQSIDRIDKTRHLDRLGFGQIRRGR